MRDIGGNKEGLTLSDHMMHGLAVLDRADANIPLELVEVLLRVGLVEIVAGVGAADDHHKEVFPHRKSRRGV